MQIIFLLFFYVGSDLFNVFTISLCGLRLKHSKLDFSLIRIKTMQCTRFLIFKKIIAILFEVQPVKKV